MRKLLIKICGITDQKALNAAALGADMCGFLFHQASPRYIDPVIAGPLDSKNLRRVGVFVNQNAEEIAEIAHIARLDMIQLHGKQNPQEMALVRQCASSRTGRKIGIIQVFWSDRYQTLADLEQDLLQYNADFFLFDAGQSGGGNGQILNWSRLIHLDSPRPWLLAGGLNVENVTHALEELGNNPSFAGVDINSGLESQVGQKDPALIRIVLEKLRHLKG